MNVSSREGTREPRVREGLPCLPHVPPLTGAWLLGSFSFLHREHLVLVVPRAWQGGDGLGWGVRGLGPSWLLA